MTYQEFVASRKKDPNQLMVEMTPYKLDLIHMSVGLVGELMEYQAASDAENAIEELGDMLFYTEGLKQAIEHLVDKPMEWLGVDKALDSYTLTEVVQVLTDKVKKYTMYDKPTDWQLLWEYCVELKELICDEVGQEHGWSKEELEASNIKKLTKRYPEGYCNKAAGERKDKEDEEAS